MRAAAVSLLFLLTACSSGPGTPGLSSPGPVLPTTPPATAPAALPTVTVTPSSRPAPRRTASPFSAPVRTPSPTRASRTLGISQVTGYRFSPRALTLRSGDSVLVTNNDVAIHTFTVDGLGIDSGDMAQGDTFRYTLWAPGRFTFVCTPHRSLGMTGTLTVTR